MSIDDFGTIPSDDADTCRICAAPAEPTAPLFHPCKCSGTIKWIHQDCLKTWLEHSKKKKCDVCHYTYSFVKVYDPSMPRTLPPHLFLKRFIKRTYDVIALALRATLVAFVWLVVIPYGTVVSWRLYFFLGDMIAQWVVTPSSDSVPPPSGDPYPPRLPWRPFTPTIASSILFNLSQFASPSPSKKQAMRTWEIQVDHPSTKMWLSSVISSAFSQSSSTGPIPSPSVIAGTVAPNTDPGHPSNMDPGHPSNIPSPNILNNSQNSGDIPLEALQALFYGLYADVTTGLVIVACLMLAFLAVLLVREYVMQHLGALEGGGHAQAAEGEEIIGNQEEAGVPDGVHAPLPAEGHIEMGLAAEKGAEERTESGAPFGDLNKALEELDFSQEDDDPSRHCSPGSQSSPNPAAARAKPPLSPSDISSPRQDSQDPPGHESSSVASDGQSGESRPKSQHLVESTSRIRYRVKPYDRSARMSGSSAGGALDRVRSEGMEHTNPGPASETTSRITSSGGSLGDSEDTIAATIPPTPGAPRLAHATLPRAVPMSTPLASRSAQSPDSQWPFFRGREEIKSLRFDQVTDQQHLTVEEGDMDYSFLDRYEEPFGDLSQPFGERAAGSRGKNREVKEIRGAKQVKPSLSFSPNSEVGFASVTFDQPPMLERSTSQSRPALPTASANGYPVEFTATRTLPFGTLPDGVPVMPIFSSNPPPLLIEPMEASLDKFGHPSSFEQFGSSDFASSPSPLPMVSAGALSTFPSVEPLPRLGPAPPFRNFTFKSLKIANGDAASSTPSKSSSPVRTLSTDKVFGKSPAAPTPRARAADTRQDGSDDEIIDQRRMKHFRLSQSEPPRPGAERNDLSEAEEQGASKPNKVLGRRRHGLGPRLARHTAPPSASSSFNVPVIEQATTPSAFGLDGGFTFTFSAPGVADLTFEKARMSTHQDSSQKCKPRSPAESFPKRPPLPTPQRQQDRSHYFADPFHSGMAENNSVLAQALGDGITQLGNTLPEPTRTKIPLEPQATYKAPEELREFVEGSARMSAQYTQTTLADTRQMPDLLSASSSEDEGMDLETDADSDSNPLHPDPDHFENIGHPAATDQPEFDGNHNANVVFPDDTDSDDDTDPMLGLGVAVMQAPPANDARDNQQRHAPIEAPNLNGGVVEFIPEAEPEAILDLQIQNLGLGGIAGNGPVAIAAPALQNGQNVIQDQGIGLGLDPDGLEGEEEDMEAIQQAIGLRGPLNILFQNAALLIVGLNFTMVVGIFAPFLIGKIVVLLVLEPARLAACLNLPFLVVRIVTDPIVDYLLFKLRHLLVSMSVLTAGYTIALADALSLPITFPTPPTLPVINDPGSSLQGRITSGSVVLKERATDILEIVGLNWTSIVEEYTDFAYSSSSNHQTITISIGYIVDFLVACLFLYLTSNRTTFAFIQRMRELFLHQLTIVKVGVFMAFELAVFPIMCGVALDLATISFFREASITSRLEFTKFAPLSSLFFHWLVGTIYMFHFAILLSTSRGIMRPGAMWFIKDPHDPTFQPVRDLMERTVLAQIRKLAISGVIYICFVAVSIRSLYYGMAALSFGSVSFLPLRWNMRIPLSVTSFDLIFVHVFGPLILRYAKPRRLARRIASVVFARLAKTLRLSSYLLGGDHLAERSHFRSWNGQINPTEQGGYRRVPNNDSVPIIRGRRMHIETDVDGQALTAEGEKRMKAQDAESIKSKRDVKKDYVVVYVPPNFYTRVVLFTLGVVMAGVVTLFFCTTVPITLGRIAFTRITQEHVHDGYALIVGLVVCWGCFTVARSIDMALKYRDPPEPKAPPRNRAPLAIYLIKRGSVWVSKFTWLYLLLGIMVPMLVGSVMHFYFVIPLSVATVRDFKPTINLVQVWAEGMLYLKFFLKALKSARGNRNPRRPDGPDLVALIEPFRKIDWLDPPAWELTWPALNVIAGFLGMIVFPGAISTFIEWAGQSQFSHILTEQRAVAFFWSSYPLVLFLAATGELYRFVKLTVLSWNQIIRDTEFLVETRLKNVEAKIQQG